MDILHWLCGSVTSVPYESYDSVAIKLAFQLNSNAITSFSARYTKPRSFAPVAFNLYYDSRAQKFLFFAHSPHFAGNLRCHF